MHALVKHLFPAQTMFGYYDESSEEEPNEPDNRAEEYWIRVWQIPEVRRELAQADEMYAFFF